MGAWIGTSGWSYNPGTLGSTRPACPPATGSPGTPQAFATAELNSSFYRWPARRRSPAGGAACPTASGSRSRPARPDPRAQTPRARDLAGAHRGRLARTGRPPGRATGAAGARPGPRRHQAGLLPRPGPGLDARRGGVPAPELALRGGLPLLAAHRAAYCVMSGASLPCVLRATTDFVYVRMHGPDRSTCTRVPTPTPTCAGGPTGSASGSGPDRTCTSTSTTTARRTRCATRGPSGRCSANDRLGRRKWRTGHQVAARRATAGRPGGTTHTFG